MHELDERPRHELGDREAERALPGGIEPPEVAVEVELAEQIDRQLEEAVFEGGYLRHRQRDTG